MHANFAILESYNFDIFVSEILPKYSLKKVMLTNLTFIGNYSMTKQ